MIDLSAQQQAAAVVLAGLTTLSISANAIIGVYQKIASMRAMNNPVRQPPLGEEAAKLYATKNDLNDLRKEWRAHCSASHKSLEETIVEIFRLMRQAAERNAEWQQGAAMQLGQIHEAVDTLKGRDKK